MPDRDLPFFHLSPLKEHRGPGTHQQRPTQNADQHRNRTQTNPNRTRGKSQARESNGEQGRQTRASQIRGRSPSRVTKVRDQGPERICSVKFFKRNTGGPEHTNRNQRRTQTNGETEHRPTRTERKERVKRESPPGGRASKRGPAKSEAEARQASRESETKAPREDESALTRL